MLRRARSGLGVLPGATLVGAGCWLCRGVSCGMLVPCCAHVMRLTQVAIHRERGVKYHILAPPDKSPTRYIEVAYRPPGFRSNPAATAPANAASHAAAAPPVSRKRPRPEDGAGSGGGAGAGSGTSGSVPAPLRPFVKLTLAAAPTEPLAVAAARAHAVQAMIQVRVQRCSAAVQRSLWVTGVHTRRRWPTLRWHSC